MSPKRSDHPTPWIFRLDPTSRLLALPALSRDSDDANHGWESPDDFLHLLPRLPCGLGTPRKRTTLVAPLFPYRGVFNQQVGRITLPEQDRLESNPYRCMAPMFTQHIRRVDASWDVMEGDDVRCHGFSGAVVG